MSTWHDVTRRRSAVDPAHGLKRFEHRRAAVIGRDRVLGYTTVDRGGDVTDVDGATVGASALSAAQGAAVFIGRVGDARYTLDAAAVLLELLRGKCLHGGRRLGRCQQMEHTYGGGEGRRGGTR